MGTRDMSPDGAQEQEPSAEVRYWKIAPGETAWNWAACRDGGYITMGWEELGDLSNLSRAEFEARVREALSRHPDWTSDGMEQVWKLARVIKEGDGIVANRGTREVLGIGTVTGPYHFVGEIRHGHRLPVRWDDPTPRQVDEGGWRRTLVKLSRKKFEEIAVATPIGGLGQPFAQIFVDTEEAEWAFDLLYEAMQRLGVEGPDDARLSLTAANRHGGQNLHFNFGKWLVLGFRGPNLQAERVRICLAANQADLDDDLIEHRFAQEKDELGVIGYGLPIDVVRPLDGTMREAYLAALDVAAERFKSYGGYPYRNRHVAEIAEAVFDPEKRMKLLKGGLSEDSLIDQGPNVWWVNQGQTLDAERAGGYLWAPTTSKGGRSLYHWDTLSELKEDDIVLHNAHAHLRYVSRVTAPAVMAERPHGTDSSEWEEAGRLVRVDYQELRPPIALEAFSRGLSKLNIVQGPIDSTGRPKQGYLFRFAPEALRLIQQSQPDTVWPDFVEQWLVGIASPLNPLYTLAECAAETGFEEAVLRRWVRAIERKKQVILYGPPGTGKTYLAERFAKHLVGGGDGIRDLVQFHPAYAYEDFIQGIRPTATDDGQLQYPVVAGRFLDFCREASGRQDRCVLIIDEINRANLARVLGEMMYLLEYRDRVIPLAAGGSLRIPSNVRIIGTMNTADRSIALVDHALRRRFAFLALYPNYDVLSRYHEGTGFDPDPLIGVLRRLNTQIGDRHYEVGITFFLREDLGREIEDIWGMEIEPYLEEYFFDQPDRVDDFRWERVGGEILT